MNNIQINLFREKILEIVIQLQNHQHDIIEGLREIYGLWGDGCLPYDESYKIISAIVDETETIIKGEIQKNFDRNYIYQQEIWEKEYLEETLPLITELLNDLFKKLKTNMF